MDFYFFPKNMEQLSKSVVTFKLGNATVRNYACVARTEPEEETSEENENENWLTIVLVTALV